MSISVLLPPGQQTFITAFTNAYYLQRVTITPPAGVGPPLQWQGTGEGSNPIGQAPIVTPNGGQNLNYTVDAQYSTDGGVTWNDSSLLAGSAVVGTLNLQLVLSEDHADQDFNDAVVQFLWWSVL